MAAPTTPTKTPMTVARIFSEARKFIAAVTGAAAVAVTAGLLSGTAERWTTGGLAVLTAFVVYIVKNDPVTVVVEPVVAVPPPTPTV